MQKQMVDERNAISEIEDVPRYRLEFWTGGPALANAMEAWDVRSRNAIEVLDWAREHAAELRPCRVLMFFARSHPGEPWLVDPIETQLIYSATVRP
ncbi:hypothetical protein [Demequina aestuarii]|uniref:hypothetical protein n=1 Tax=Demequina aestuarii TaxID=327095 RepID=UPI0007824788|nr:hypothetical protein [Demequina aestuarii]